MSFRVHVYPCGPEAWTFDVEREGDYFAGGEVMESKDALVRDAREFATAANLPLVIDGEDPSNADPGDEHSGTPHVSVN